jgi:ribonuclease P protein subunit RPR2
MIRGKKPISQIKIAEERIAILLDLAEREFAKYPERTKRYVQLARKIGLRYNVRLSKGQKRMFCKACNSLLIPGRTSQVRLKSEKKVVEVKCLICSRVYKYPFTKSKNI